MNQSGYAAWKSVFQTGNVLKTQVKSNEFLIRSVEPNGIEISIPRKNENPRKVILQYDKLDALWEDKPLRNVSFNRGSANPTLNSTINEVWRKAGLAEDNTNEAQYWALVRERVHREATLLDEDAADDDLQDEQAYVPEFGDRRPAIWRQIRERRGQTRFRDALRERYGDSCLITRCTTLAVLEAAHINPYRGEDDNHPENGLLLRSDIHTLFDLNLLGIDPDSFEVRLHPSIKSEYGRICEQSLRLTSAYPSKEALRLRFHLFEEKLARA